MAGGGVGPSDTERSVEALQRSDLASGELEASLRAVADATAELFSADGGGIMLLDDQQSLHYVGATNGRAAALEAAQEETGEGPCVDSLMHGVEVWTSDLPNDPRWPLLRSQVGEIGVRAVLGIPLRLGLTPVGSLNVYRHRAHDWGPTDIGAMQAHGRVIEELLGTAMLAQRQSVIVDQLNSALLHRVTIERAIGFLMASQRLDAVKAFHELRSFARSERVRVAEVAARVLDSQEFPPPAIG